jgi:hypothetical protein
MNTPLAILFSLLSLSGIAQAVTVSPSGSSDQNQINQALQTGNVYLSAGVYEINSGIILPRDRTLSGDSNAVIQVSSSSSQWFTGSTGIITCSDPQNIEVSGFQIDGNCQNLPHSFNSNDQDPHDCERAVYIIGSSDDFGEDISIHDLTIHDTFSDGVHVRFSKNVQVSNLIESNCQHEGVYFCEVMNSIISNCQTAGITSDCLRVENCQGVKVFDNILFSYTGDHNNGAYEKGENDLQVGNQGRSFGTGSPKPDSIQDIEIYNNTFAGDGLKAIQADSVALESQANIFIHDNKFIGSDELKTSGITFNLDNISYTNPPTLDQSENILNSIFDILNHGYSFTYLDTQTSINASVSVTEYNNSYNPHSLVYVVGEGLSNVLYEYDGKSTNHYFSINGENSDLWTGDLQHEGNAVYLNGSLDASKLQVTCFNSQGYCKITDFNITEVPDDSGQILNPSLWAFIGTLIILGFSIYRNFRRVITRW